MKHGKFLLLLLVVMLVASCNRDPKVQAQRYVANGNKFFDKAKYKEASIMYRRALQKDLLFGEAYYRLALADLKLASYGDAVRALRRAVELQPKNSDAAVKLADIYMAATVQDPTHATELVKEVNDLTSRLLSMDPNSYEGHRLQGQMELIQGKPEDAVKEFEICARLKPDQTDLSLAYFQALIANKQTEQAQKLGLSVIEKNKNFSPMYDLLYLSYMQQNQTAEAEQILRRKVENNPQKASYLIQLAGHYLVAHRREDLDAVIKKVTDEKQFPDGHLLAGDLFFFRAREFESAREQYEAGMKAFPKDRAAYQKRMVELLATTGRNPDANQLLATILKDNPKDRDAIAMRAALMLQTGNLAQITQATNDLQSLVSNAPNNHLLRYNLARAYIAKNDIEQARLQLETAIKLRPDFLVARDLLAKIYLQKGDNAKALKEADEAIAMNKDDLQARLTRSTALLGVSDRQKAADELDTVLKMAPNNPDARYQAGYLAWQDKDYKKAEKIFDDLSAANPKDVRGLVGRVETLASQNKMDEAIKAMEAAVSKQPDRRDFKLVLANMYVRNQRYDAAISLVQDLLKADPKSADLLIRLAETQRRKGDLNGSIDTFRRASQANPSDTRPLLQLGLLMDGTGRREQAKPIYEQILKIQPDHPIALNNLAFIKAEEGTDLDAALTMAQKARQKLPDSPDIMDTLGWIYIKKNLSDDAVRTFRELNQARPDRASFHLHYGIALLQKGDKPSAKRELETAIKYNPSKDDAGKIRELLSSL
jgi:tetratricopeptide (TPR) repeat protein